ncbi:MAG: hypothetical protein ABFC34_13935 [Methanobacterium sp.]
MDFIKKIIDIVKSPIGSIAIRLVIPLTKIGISWTPTKTDDYYLAKIAYEIIEGQMLAKELMGIELSVKEQTSLINAKLAMDNAKIIMENYKKSKKKRAS